MKEGKEEQRDIGTGRRKGGKTGRTRREREREYKKDGNEKRGNK